MMAEVLEVRTDDVEGAVREIIQAYKDEGETSACVMRPRTLQRLVERIQQDQQIIAILRAQLNARERRLRFSVN